MKQFIIILICVFVVSCKTNYSPAPLAVKRIAPSAPALAAPTPTTKSITLAWDDPVNTGVSYRVFQGDSAGVYNKTLTTTNKSIVVSGLVPKSTYYFAATSYNSQGNESAYSNEVLYRVPGKRAKLVTEQTVLLASGSWTPIATNYDETTNASGFYRVVVTVEE